MDKVYYYDVTVDASEYDVDIPATTHFDTNIASEIRIIESRSYLDLKDKPRIEGVILEGNKRFVDLGLDEIAPQDIDEIMFGDD